MLTGISLTCFAATYGITFLLELARVFLHVAVRLSIVVGIALAGIVAHTIYLTIRLMDGIQDGAPLASWYEWCLLAAWIVVVAYVVLAIRRPRNSIGLFILPIVLGLVALAYTFRNTQPFTHDQATQYWGMLHGILLLLGTVAVLLGFMSGILYLAQSYRLKRRLPPSREVRLPSLEWLQQANSRALLTSSLLLVGGVIAGIGLNLVRRNGAAVVIPWGDPIIWSSVVMAGWLTIVTLLNALYKPVQKGRKIACLTVANFAFLLFALAATLGRHASNDPPESNMQRSSSKRCVLHDDDGSLNVNHASLLEKPPIA